MSSKISQAQLDANTTTYAIDDYRKMVNYESGTNKGYVRFAKGADGKLKIEKFNNKIDVPLSWRSNTSAAHNKAVRDKFLAAMEKDLAYLSNADTIRDLILRPKNNAQQVDEGLALSRRDLKKIFVKFDAEFNTAEGRIRIVENFYKSAMERCGFHGSKDDFINRYLKPQMHGVDPTKTLYFETDDANAGNPDPTKRMKMDENGFRSYLVSLDSLVAAAMNRIDAESACKSIARAAAKQDAGFGLNLPEQDVAKVRASLTALFQAENVQDIELGFGTAGTGLELFLKNVLPVMVRQVAENIKTYADRNDNAAVEEMLDAELNFDRVFDMAKRFIEGARQAVETASNIEIPPKEDKDAFDKIASAVQQMRLNAKNTIEQLTVLQDARKAFVFNVNAPKGQYENLAQDIARLTPTYIKEAHVDDFTAKFLRENFASVARDIPQVSANFRQKAKEHIDQLVVAGQLNYGERWVLSTGADLKDTRLKGASGADKFLEELSDAAIDIANEEKGGMPMLNNLLTRTIPKILNQRIHNALASKGQARLYIDPESRLKVIAQLKLVGKSYRKFFLGREELLLGKAMNGIKSQLDRLLKKGNITPAERDNLLSDFETRLNTALSRAVERFYEAAPLDAEETDEQTIDKGVKKLEQLFSEEKDDVIADMRQRMSTITLANAYGGEQRRALLDLKAHVDACVATLNQDGVKLTVDVPAGDFETALHKLYYKVLEKTLEGRNLGHKQIGENLNQSVQNEFVSQAKKLVSTVNKLSDDLDANMRKYIEAMTDTALQHNNLGYYEKDLGKDEMKALRKSFADSALLAMKGLLDAEKRKFLAYPETYTKKAVKASDLALSFFSDVGPEKVFTEESIPQIFEGVIDKRRSAVMSWLYNPTGANGNSTLAKDLVTAEKSRVSAEGSPLKRYAEKLPANELSNILNAAVEQVIQRAEKYAVSYATGGRDKFNERIGKEIREIVDKRVKAMAEFREGFIKDAEPIIAKYVDSLKTATKSGIEVAKAKRDQILDELSRAAELPKLKGFAVAFDGMLQKMVKDKIDMKVADFLKYSETVTKAYERCIPAYEEHLRAKFDELKAAGATDEDIQHIETKLMPVLRDSMATQLQADPDFYAGEKGPAGARMWADGQIESFLNNLKAVNLSTDEGLKETLSNIGLSRIAKTPETFAAARSNIDTYIGNEDVKKLLAETRKAVLTSSAYGLNETSAEPVAAARKIKEFHEGVKAALLGLQKVVLQERFNKKQVGPAMDLFKMWLQKYNLPDILVSTLSLGSVKLEEAAMAHFKERVARLQQAVDKDGYATEALLSPKYVTDLLTYINRLARNAMFVSMQEELVNRRMTEITTAKENARIYGGAVTEPGQAPVSKEMAMLNFTGLREHILYALRNAELALKQKVVSFEDMYRWKDLIQEEFDRQVADTGANIELYKRFAQSRVEMIDAIDRPEVSGDEVIKGYLNDSLQDYFKGKDIRDEKVISHKFLQDNNVSAMFLINYLSDQLIAKVAQTKATLKELANKNPRPDEVHLQLLNVKQLENQFRQDADAIVEAMALQPKGKKGTYTHLFHLINDEVTKVVKKEAEDAKKQLKGVKK